MARNVRIGAFETNAPNDSYYENVVAIVDEPRWVEQLESLKEAWTIEKNEDTTEPASWTQDEIDEVFVPSVDPWG